MPSEWNVRRAEPSISELTENVAELQAEATDALAEGGEYGRPYRQAAELLRVAERRLASAKLKAERQERDAKRDPREIVDRLMEP